MRTFPPSRFWMVCGPTCGLLPVRHETVEAAEAKAGQFARENPGQTFFVLETVSAAVTGGVLVHRYRSDEPNHASFVPAPVSQLNMMRFLRKKVLRMTQEEMAELTGVNQATVSRWETGDLEPSIGQIRLVREAAIAAGVEWNDRWSLGDMAAETEHPSVEYPESVDSPARRTVEAAS